MASTSALSTTDTDANPVGTKLASSIATNQANQIGQKAQTPAGTSSLQTVAQPSSAIANVAKQLSQQKPAATAAPAAPAGTVDTSGYFKQALDGVDKLDATAKQGASDQLAQGQRRAATLAALSGRGVGQGYLAGNQQAQLNSQNAMTQELAKNEQMRQQIYGTQESQGFQNNQRLSQNQFSNDQRVDQNTFNVQQKTAEDKSEATAQQVQQKTADYTKALSDLNGLSYGAFSPQEQQMITAAANGDAGAQEQLAHWMNYLEYTKHTGKKVNAQTLAAYNASQDGGGGTSSAQAPTSIVDANSNGGQSG
jgi:hypothetical protein